MDSTFDVIVIGAGMGGLMSAALLARGGKKVLVLETSDRIGGFQQRREVEGFLIDANFHFLQEAGTGRPIRQLLEAAGVEAEYLSLDPVAEFGFPDRVARMTMDRNRYIHDLIAMFPEEKKGITALFEAMARLYEQMKEWPAAELQNVSPEQMPPELAALAVYANDTLDDFLDRFISSRELKAILGGWATYFGYCGSRIAALPVIVLSESCWDGGVHHPAGGLATIAQGLKTTIEQGGGAVRLSTIVQKILIQQQKAVGVELSNGETIPANTVVSNADVFTTFHNLVGEDKTPPGLIDKLDTMEQFRSPITVYIGVRAEGLNLEQRAAVHVVFPGYDTEAGDDAQVEGLLDRIAVSVGIPTLVTPELAPSGHHLLKIYSFIGAPLIKRLQTDEAFKNNCIQAMVQAAERGIPGLSDRLVMSRISTDIFPDLYNKYTNGAIGWAPNMKTMMAASDQSTAIAGLYLVGQWTNTGPAMNNVFRSSQRAASMILAGS